MNVSNNNNQAEASILRHRAFTLTELLVVIAIIGILASMLLPSLTRAKQKTKVTQCLNNLRQLGIAVSMYVHDNSDTFPFASGICIGGRDPRADVVKDLPPAVARPLFAYLKPSEVFRCPDDHGAQILIDLPKGVLLKPTSWEIAGCSYMYNVFEPYHKTLHPLDGTLAGNKVGWVPNPSLFILMHEPPARSFPIKVNNVVMHVFQHWHYAPITDWHHLPNTDDWPQRDLPADGLKFISPVLFVDGHVITRDFSAGIRSNPDYVFEATRDWIWYKPAPEKDASPQ